MYNETVSPALFKIIGGKLILPHCRIISGSEVVVMVVGSACNAIGKRQTNRTMENIFVM